MLKFKQALPLRKPVCTIHVLSFKGLQSQGSLGCVSCATIGGLTPVLLSWLIEAVILYMLQPQ